MEKLGKAMFNLTRFQVLQTKLNSQLEKNVPDYYAYAWDEELYPFLDSSPLHEDLKDYFKITKEQVDQISKYADSEWLEKRLHTFYQYEDYFKARHNDEGEITRSVLISVFRYLYLHNCFDEKFWKKLLTPPEYPTEAGGITREYQPPYLL
jgi:hypothetical protein